MCGICGIMLRHGAEVRVDDLRYMTDVMMHRGPDEAGFFVQGETGLGFRRLAIVDVLHGHQPIANEDRTVWVVCNGEIYNHKSLRNELVARGHVFASNSDTEVLVHLYEEYGIDCIRRLRGMFAVGIVDLNQQELFLVRDPFGIKPLFYVHTSAGLHFASDLRALLPFAPHGHEVDEQAMWDYFTLQYVPNTESLIKGIQKLPPAHYLRFHDGKATSTRYWRPEYQPDFTKSASYFGEAIASSLQGSVNRHLQGEVNIGAFLSSGVDSSTLAALAGKNRDLETFSVGFEDADEHLDELGISSQTASALGLRNQQRLISSTDIENQMPQMLEALEEPLGDPSALALYFLSELASQKVTVVLSGEGADEIFGGYPIYHEPKSLALFKYLPNWSNEVLERLAKSLPYGVKGKSFLLRGTTPIERRFLGNIHVFREAEKAELFNMKAFDKILQPTFRLTDPLYRQSAHHDDITRMQLIDLQTWLPGDVLQKADKMTMAHSLELRVPFLDLDLFEVAATVPVEYRVRDSQGKYILREAVRQWLPAGIANRPKLGFPVPYRKWLRGRMQNLLWDALLSSRFRHYFSIHQVERMLLEHRSGERDHGRALWTILIFLLWTHVFDNKMRVRQDGLTGGANLSAM